MNILRASSQAPLKVFATMAAVAGLLFSSAITGAPAHSATFTGDVSCTTEGTVQVVNDVVTSTTNCRGTVEIPASVTAIGNDAFAALDGIKDFYLTGITFASGSLLETIGDRAFFQNRALISIEIPAGVTSIGTRAFQSNGALTTVTFATGSALTSVGTYAFNEASSLTSVVIPSDVVTIGDNAFALTNSLSSVTFAGNALSVIGGRAFASSGITSITIPAGVTSIGAAAFFEVGGLSTVIFLGNAPTAVENFPAVTSNSFYGISADAVAKVGASATGFGVTGSVWNSLLKVQREGDILCSTGGFFSMTGTTVSAQTSCTGEAVIPATATHIGNLAFKGATSVTSLRFATPSSLGAIGIEAFAGMTEVTSFAIPQSVSGISDGAFDGNTALSSITFAAGSLLTLIGNNAFRGTSSLGDFTVPSGVTAIGGSAFEDSGLSRITFLGPTPLVGPDLFKGREGARAFVPSGATNSIVGSVEPELDFGVSGSNWNGLYVIKSPDLDCTQNGFVTVSATVVRSVNDGCAGGVAIPSEVTEITASAFRDSPVTTISFQADSALTTIGDGAFEGALNLDRLYIGANVSTIGVNAFKNTQSLEFFTVATENSSFSASADYVLFNQTKSELIAYPAARPVTPGGYTGPSTQASYNVPDTVTEIAESAFYNASNIREIVFAGNAPTVGTDAFFGVGAGATAKVTFAATGFGNGPTWNGLTIVRAAGPSGSSADSTSVTPPVVVIAKPVAKRVALSKIVAKLLANGVPVLKGRSASKQLEFKALSVKIDATDLATLRKVAADFNGKKGKLILVGFVNGMGQTNTSAKKIAVARAKSVAMALVSLGVDFEIGYAGFGARNKANPKTSDNRVAFRWLTSK